MLEIAKKALLEAGVRLVLLQVGHGVAAWRVWLAVGVGGREERGAAHGRRELY